MTPNFRAMCAELVAAVDLLCGSGYSPRQPVSRLILTVHVEALEELAVRARALLAEAVAEGPTDEELDSFLVDVACQHGNVYYSDPLILARAALARWGRPAAQPVAVSERWPEFSDCDPQERVWAWNPVLDHWKLSRINRSVHTHWLPAHALPTPEATND